MERDMAFLSLTEETQGEFARLNLTSLFAAAAQRARNKPELDARISAGALRLPGSRLWPAGLQSKANRCRARNIATDARSWRPEVPLPVRRGRKTNATLTADDADPRG
jgi:hypothetical protein